MRYVDRKKGKKERERERENEGKRERERNKGRARDTPTKNKREERMGEESPKHAFIYASVSTWAETCLGMNNAFDRALGM